MPNSRAHDTDGSKSALDEIEDMIRAEEESRRSRDDDEIRRLDEEERLMKVSIFKCALTLTLTHALNCVYAPKKSCGVVGPLDEDGYTHAAIVGVQMQQHSHSCAHIRIWNRGHDTRRRGGGKVAEEIHTLHLQLQSRI